jgi:hypothetical protein
MIVSNLTDYKIKTQDFFPGKKLEFFCTLSIILRACAEPFCTRQPQGSLSMKRIIYLILYRLICLRGFFCKCRLSTTVHFWPIFFSWKKNKEAYEILCYVRLWVHLKFCKQYEVLSPNSCIFYASPKPCISFSCSQQKDRGGYANSWGEKHNSYVLQELN